MSIQTRRQICRVGFLVFCLAPTTFVSCWIFWPDRAAAWKDDLSIRFGWEVSVQQVSHPRPGVTGLNGVEIVDAEAGTLASAERIEITEGKTGFLVNVPHLTVTGDRLDLACELICERVLRRRGSGQAKVVVQSERVVVVGSDKSTKQVFHDLAFTLEHGGGKAKAVLSFRAAQESRERIEIAIDRTSAQGGGSVTSWTLSTGGSALPCSLIFGDSNSLSVLGDQCRFSGRVWGRQSGNDWASDLSGRFLDVDLDSLVAQRFPHVLTGRAEVEFKRAHVESGRLTNASGTIRAFDGAVGVSLLASSAKHLRLKQVRALYEEAVEFGELNFGFEIDGFALSIGGQCDNTGTIVTDRNGTPLLAESETPRVNVLALVRMLVPVADFAVPLTRETAPLLSIFPVPTAKGSSQ